MLTHQNFKRLDVGVPSGRWLRSLRTASFRVAVLAAASAASDNSCVERNRFFASFTMPFAARSLIASWFFSSSFFARSRAPESDSSPLSTLRSKAFLRPAFLRPLAAVRSSRSSSSRPFACLLGARCSSGAFKKASDMTSGIVSSIFTDGTLDICSPETPSTGGRGVKCAFVSWSSLNMSLVNKALVAAFSASSFASPSVLWPRISASYCFA
mmetsp:Transcript_58263/g.162424  ORF Transcript_58263/g.162424 Transcript_58263/m.162424 type:complete len:212 (+) Transcript_58263:218-853(+)